MVLWYNKSTNIHIKEVADACGFNAQHYFAKVFRKYFGKNPNEFRKDLIYTVYQENSISKAAQKLFVSQPSLSIMIRKIEEEIGMPLFDRTSNRILLNAQGQILLRYVDQVLSALENAKQEINQSILRQGPHISLVNTNSVMWDNLIATFTSEFSNYTLSCSSISGIKFAEIGLSSRYDFLLAYESEIPPAYAEKLDSIFLFRAIPTVMVHKDHPLAQKTELDAKDIMQERLFLPVPGTSLYLRLQQIFKLNNLSLPADNFYSYMVRQKMVVENKGISFFSQHPGNHSHPDIRYIPLTDPFAPWVARLYWRKEHALTEQEAAFRDFAELFYRDMH